MKVIRMQFGVSTAAYYGRMETEEAAAEIAALQPDCCEVFLQTFCEYSKEFAGRVLENLEGLPCTSVHPQGTQFENGFFSRSARQREDALNQYRRVLDAAAELGAARYVYHGRYTPRLKPLPFMPEQNAEVLCRMAEESACRGIAIAWENVFWCQLTTPERVRKIRSLLPQVCFTLDIKQAMRAHADPMEFIPAMGDALRNVHLCDWNKSGELCLPGEGCFEFRLFFRKLLEAGYEGPVILEPYTELVRSRDAMAASLRFLQKEYTFAIMGGSYKEQSTLGEE